jgi:hypothetical protein
MIYVRCIYNVHTNYMHCIVSILNRQYVILRQNLAHGKD